MTAVDAATPDVVPRVYGSGEVDDIGWLLLERGSRFLSRESASDVAAVVATTARYQLAAASIDAPTSRHDVQRLRASLVDAEAKGCPGDVQRRLAAVEDEWELVSARCGLSPCHGDVHLNNAVGRGTAGPALLIDPMPILTVWPWDAANLELTSGHPGVVRQLGDARAGLGLPEVEGLERVAQIVLGWSAAYWWSIAPWRHDRPEWREVVRLHIDS